MSLPWFPSESAHDARCYAHHCVCSNNSCHQRPLRCNSYRQSGLALSMAFFHVFRSRGPGEGRILRGAERCADRLGSAQARARRGSVCVRVCLGIGAGAPAGPATCGMGGEPGRGVGMGDWQGCRRFSKSKPPTPTLGPEKRRCETPGHTVAQDLQHFCFQSQVEIPP